MRVALYASRYPGERFATPPSLQFLAGVLAGRGLVSEDEVLFAESAEEAVAFAPDVFGVSSVSQTIGDAEHAARFVRAAAPDCWTALGGYHISALPATLPACFDVGVLGEGEETFAELMRLYQAENKFSPSSLAKIQGIIYRDEAGKLVPLDVKKGDKVLFGKWSGTEVKIDGQELLIMKESDIMGIVG